jgi:hypothetical protein
VEYQISYRNSSKRDLSVPGDFFLSRTGSTTGIGLKRLRSGRLRRAGRIRVGPGYSAQTTRQLRIGSEGSVPITTGQVVFMGREAPMRSVMVLLIVLTISGCSDSQFVRRPMPQAVVAWWQNVRELNRPDPPNLAWQRFKNPSSPTSRRYSTWQ